MGDEEIGQVELGLQVLEQIDDLGLDRDVEGGHGLVTDDQLGIEGEGPGDADTLALAAAELVRVTVVEVGVQTHHPQQLLDPRVLGLAVHDLEVGERLGDDVADRHPGIERGEGILEDHLEMLALLAQALAAQPGELDAVEDHPARGGRGELGEHAGERRFAASGLTDQPHRLPGPDLEADAVNGPADGADPDVEVLDHIDGAQQGFPGRLGARALRRPRGEGASHGHAPRARGLGPRARRDPDPPARWAGAPRWRPRARCRPASPRPSPHTLVSWSPSMRRYGHRPPAPARDPR